MQNPEWQQRGTVPKQRGTVSKQRGTVSTGSSPTGPLGSATSAACHAVLGTPLASRRLLVVAAHAYTDIRVTLYLHQ